MVSNAYPNCESRNVQVDSDLDVQDHRLAHEPIAGQRITRKIIEDLATKKYRTCRKGITFKDLQKGFSLRKTRVQRSLKHFHDRHVLFTGGDLISQGIYLIQNTNPQQYFPACIKSDIVEDLKKRSRNVQVEPTGSSLYNISNPSNQSNFPDRGDALSNVVGYQKAQSFLEVLIQLPYTQLHIHKLQLMLSIDKNYYQDLTNKAASINRAKLHEENIGRRHVTYTFSPNGRVQIAIRRQRYSI